VGLRVSEKHGVNPSLGVCFWCGESDGTVLLLGQLPDDREAPRQMVASYEPCDKCKAGMAQGITLIEAQNQPFRDDQPPMAKSGGQDVYPSGRMVVITEEAFRRIFSGEAAEAGLRRRKAFILPEVWTAIGLGGGGDGGG